MIAPTWCLKQVDLSETSIAILIKYSSQLGRTYFFSCGIDLKLINVN